MRTLRFGVKRLLRALNLDVRRIGGDMATLRRLAEADPLTFQYLSDLKIAPLRMIGLAQARAGIMGFRYDVPASHPLIQAFCAARKECTAEQRRTAARGVLSEYYRRVRPASALEIVGLRAEEAPGLASIPLHSWVLPWSERSVDEIGEYRRICLEEEGLSNGTAVSLADGATHYGPVSEKKLDLEAARIVRLARSFEASGFQASTAHPIEVIGLRVGSDYRWFVVQGQHRLAACAAFGIATVPARIVRLVRREDVEFWPHVAVSTFTVPGALKCFDRLFAGGISPCASLWLEQVHKSKTKEARPVQLPEERAARSRLPN